MAPALTKSQNAALAWLIRQGGDGVFDKSRVLVAAGERPSARLTGQAGFMYSTWLALERAGLVRFYGGKTGRARVQVIKVEA